MCPAQTLFFLARSVFGHLRQSVGDSRQSITFKNPWPAGLCEPRAMACCRRSNYALSPLADLGRFSSGAPAGLFSEASHCPWEAAAAHRPYGVVRLHSYWAVPCAPSARSQSWQSWQCWWAGKSLAHGSTSYSTLSCSLGNCGTPSLVGPAYISAPQTESAAGSCCYSDFCFLR